MPATKEKVNENLQPICIGMGAILASIAMPSLSKTVGNWAIQQSYVENEVVRDSDSEKKKNTPTNHKRTTSTREAALKANSTRRKSQISFDSTRRGSHSSATMIPHYSPSLEDLHQGGAFSLNAYIQKTLQRQLSSPDIRRDHLTATETNGVGENQLTRSVSSSIYSDRAIEFLEDKIDKEELIESHYFHAEMQFIMALIATSERLTNVPKPARHILHILSSQGYL
jgi:phosphatidylinositol 4-kinase